MNAITRYLYTYNVSRNMLVSLKIVQNDIQLHIFTLKRISRLSAIYVERKEAFRLMFHCQKGTLKCCFE